MGVGRLPHLHWVIVCKLLSGKSWFCIGVIDPQSIPTQIKINNSNYLYLLFHFSISIILCIDFLNYKYSVFSFFPCYLLWFFYLFRDLFIFLPSGTTTCILSSTFKNGCLLFRLGLVISQGILGFAVSSNIYFFFYIA